MSPPTGPVAVPAGYYQFTDLSPGYYVVEVDDTTLPTSGGSPIPQTADPDRDGESCDSTTYPGLPACDHEDASIIIEYGTTYAGADFGYQPSGVIGDYVWFDFNGDGVQDANELGLSDVMVTATMGGTVLTNFTDPDGFYSFANLADGLWTIAVTSPSGLMQTFEVDGTLNASTTVAISGGLVSSNGNAWCMDVCSLDIDYGFALNGSNNLSGGVCLDDPTEDGLCSSTNDTPLDGRTVYLYDSSTNLVGTTSTDVSRRLSVCEPAGRRLPGGDRNDRSAAGHCRSDHDGQRDAGDESGGKRQQRCAGGAGIWGDQLLRMSTMHLS